MVSMRVIGRAEIPYPYVEPTAAWEVEIRNGRKSARFLRLGGQGYASGPGDLDLVLASLRDYAEDRYMVDSWEEYSYCLAREECEALAKLGQQVYDGLVHLGLEEE